MIDKEVSRKVFSTLYDLNLNDKIKDKIGLKYLSWAYAWGELKKVYPDAEMKIYTRTVKTQEVNEIVGTDGSKKVVTTSYENEVPYFTDGRTCFVKVGVTIEGIEYFELLPVMDNKNNALNVVSVTSVAVNKAIQRAFVKACARHGLGLYVYAGEDLPEVEKVIINYAGIEADAEKSVKSINEETFNSLKKDVIQMVQDSQQLVDSDAGEQIFSYVTKLFPNKRLSTLTYIEDAENVQKLHAYLSTLIGLFSKNK